MAEHDDAAETKLNLSKAVTDEADSDAEPTVVTVTDLQDEDAEATDTEDADSPADPEAPTAAKRRLSPMRTAALVGVAIVVVMASVVGYLGYRTYQSQTAQDRDNLFLGVARQGAVNLTTIDWKEADTDIQRILDSATGTFYDDFSKRSQPFVEVVKQAQSKSVGTVTEAGLESSSGDEAQVLVAVSVKTTNLGAVEQQPRAWRMRIDVQRIGDQAKVSNVQFVP